jgi:hypothetical protein
MRIRGSPVDRACPRLDCHSVELQQGRADAVKFSTDAEAHGSNPFDRCGFFSLTRAAKGHMNSL